MEKEKEINYSREDRITYKSPYTYKNPFLIQYEDWIKDKNKKNIIIPTLFKTRRNNIKKNVL